MSTYLQYYLFFPLGVMTATPSTYNETTFHQQLPEFFQAYMICLVSRPSAIIFLIFAIVNLCLHLPLSVFIHHHGLQQWKKRSVSSSAPTSHSDCFTYQLASMELIGAIGYVLIICTICEAEAPYLLETGVLLLTYMWFGEIFFLMLMCLEHYMAVVHPIMYLKLRNERWIRIRNVSVGFIWLLCLVGIVFLKVNLFIIINFCLLIVCVPAVTFCNCCVLKVLKRPGPGEQGGGRERADNAKKRAFYTILAILGALVLRFAWGFFSTVLYVTGRNGDCITMTIEVWFNLPSSLVVPLLFVLRTGKCVCCKKTI